MDRTHNPEFTVLEFYTAYKDYEWMMHCTEQLLEQTAIATNGQATNGQAREKVFARSHLPRR